MAKSEKGDLFHGQEMLWEEADRHSAHLQDTDMSFKLK
jgi:hypothetical protein